jgi:hypothetical protein
MASESTGIDTRPGENQGALQTPVLLLIFNRPKTTQATLESLRAVRPTALYIAADGPRRGSVDDATLCAEARRAATAVDWQCKIRTFFREENAGCAVNVSTAITWFFEHVEAGIVLEDDCVPGPSFYRFCTELLARYREDPRIMHIAGTNLQYGRRRGRASYHFSKYPNVWGWASWRRAWKHYDFSLRPAWKLDDTWDTQWQLSIAKAGGLSVVPGVNLVKNIGVGPGATHTNTPIRAAFLAAEQMRFPMVHPRDVVADRRADIFTYYAHHRLVKHHWLIWWHRLVDFLYLKLKPVKRKVFGPRSRPPQAGQP